MLIPPIKPDAPWEAKVMAEAMQFVGAVQQNFQHGLDVSLVHLPDPHKQEFRAIQIDYFFDAIVGLAANITCKYGDNSASKAFEEVVVERLREKFEYIRGKLADAKKPKLVEPPKPGETVQ